MHTEIHRNKSRAFVTSVAISSVQQLQLKTIGNGPDVVNSEHDREDFEKGALELPALASRNTSGARLAGHPG